MTPPDAVKALKEAAARIKKRRTDDGMAGISEWLALLDAVDALPASGVVVPREVLVQVREALEAAVVSAPGEGFIRVSASKRAMIRAALAALEGALDVALGDPHKVKP